MSSGVLNNFHPIIAYLLTLSGTYVYVPVNKSAYFFGPSALKVYMMLRGARCKDNGEGKREA